jgi:hypothetical protein
MCGFLETGYKLAANDAVLLWPAQIAIEQMSYFPR